MSRIPGWAVAVTVVGAIGLVLLLNVDWNAGKSGASTEKATYQPGSKQSQQEGLAEPSQTGAARPFREYPIGEAERDAEHLQIAAVFFPAVPMEGMPVPAGEDALHLEADVRATAENPNGFAFGQFIPYLKIGYEIRPKTGEPLRGDLIPMVARDGLHYGATVVLPGPGQYTLSYHVEPPSVGGLGRHDDPVTGVSPWWKPFDLSWDWDYKRPKPEP